MKPNLKQAEAKCPFTAYFMGRARAFRTAWTIARSYRADQSLLAFYRQEMRFSAQQARLHCQIAMAGPIAF